MLETHPGWNALTRPIELSRPDWRLALALFLFTFWVVQWQNGNRFQLMLDEGIYLDGASRVARGQAPYRDFFTFTGPGTFWVYGAVFQLFGATLANARFVLSVEIALLAAIIYWIAATLTTGTFAAGIALMFATFCLDSPGNLYITHRWDSNTAAMAAVALACLALRKPNRACWIASGACLAIAAWITPPFVTVIVLVAAWTAWTGGFRAIRDFSLGVAAPSLIATGVLLYHRAFEPMTRQLLWATSNYSAGNRVPYGYLLENPHGVKLIEVLTPALLPVITYLGVAALLFLGRKQLQQNKAVLTLLVVFSAGVLVAGLPRLGAHQLVFVSPVFWILCGYVLFTAAGPMRRWLTPALAVASCLMLISSFLTDRRFTAVVETNAAEVKCTPEDAKLLSALIARISPGDTLFVFPYLPIVYFLTGAENPSRYSFLQPGMMTDTDESIAAGELRVHPPQWMLWVRFPAPFWMKLWPHSHAASLDFPKLEKYMPASYREVLRIEMNDQQTMVLGCSRDCTAAR